MTPPRNHSIPRGPMDAPDPAGPEPSDWAAEFAARHDVRLRLEAPLPEDVPGYKYDDNEGPVVVLNAAMPPERRHFALAHEVAHILLGHGDELEEGEELEANRLAAELLLPTERFSREAWQPLRELKRLFPHASHEAIARRRLAFVPGVLTIVDDGRLTRRLVSEGFAAPPHPAPFEWNLIERAFETRGDLEEEAEGLRLSAVFVDEGRGVARVLLLAEGDEPAA